MKPYLDLLRNIVENGHDHPDRTGTGRRSIFGTETRFNLQDGFPLITTRKAAYKAAFKEMFWFICGDTNIENLQKENVHIWDKWVPSDEEINSLVESTTFKPGIDPDVAKSAMITYLTKYRNNIGPMYGNIWRNTSVSDPVSKILLPIKELGDIASDVMERYKAEYDDIQPKDSEGNLLPFEDFVRIEDHDRVDQLQLLITGLKKDPYSARHVVTAWLPENIPLSGKSPGMNVLLGKGCLAPCHAMFQCFVTPNPNGKPYLSLKMFQRKEHCAL